MLQEVDLPAVFTGVRCEGVRGTHVCMHNAPVLDLPRLFLDEHNCPQSVPVMACQGAPPPAVHSKRDRDAAGSEHTAAAGTPTGARAPLTAPPQPCSTLQRYAQPSRAAQHAVCEYVGMLACGAAPAHAMPSSVGTSIDGEIHVWSWEGVMGGLTVTNAVQSCMDKVDAGHWPWACVLLHGLCQSPFAWKGKDDGDAELQRMARAAGRKCGHVDGVAGQSVGALLLLPGRHVCLVAMSGAGDNFCKF